MEGLKTERKDLLPPCRDCPKKYPGCPDHCTEDAYIRYLTMHTMKLLDDAKHSGRKDEVSRDWKNRRKNLRGK